MIKFGSTEVAVRRTKLTPSYLVQLTIVAIFLMLTVIGREGKSTNYAIQSNIKLNNSNGLLSSSIPIGSDPKKIMDYVERHLLKPPSINPYNLSSSRLSYRPVFHTMSWPVIHKYIRLLFEDQDAGFFVEAGALDGEMLSNTLWLEKEKGWSGLLVEPDASNYRALMRKNRKAWTLNACLSTLSYPKVSNFKSIRPAITNKQFGSSYHWLFRGHSYNMDVKDNSEKDYKYHTFDYSSVLCLPLDYLLQSLNVTTIDFLSLDIEGGEFEVLELFPWGKVHLRSLVVEFGGIERTKTEFINLLEGKGYHLVNVSKHSDYFFVNKEETILLQKLNLK